jgi:hypothetical protein
MPSIFANKTTGILVTRDNPTATASITYNPTTTDTVLTGFRFLEPVKGRQLTDLLSQNGLQQGQFYYVYFEINDLVNLLDYVYFNLNKINQKVAYSAGTDSQKLQIKSLEAFDAGIRTRNKMAVCQSLN